jgi:PRTRC genetic system protein E
MSMFKELYAIATGATLAMLISADEKTGRLTISVLPKPKKDLQETALTKDLTLTATPEEFDKGFINALTGYRDTREKLVEQAEATKEVLDAAKAASAKKAGEAVSKAAKQTAKASCKTSAASDEAGDDDHESGEHASDIPEAAEVQPQLFG